MQPVNFSERHYSVNQFVVAEFNETPMGTTSEGSERERGSNYRGVNKAKNKNTYTAHMYNNGLIRDKGRTVYLGTFDHEEDAARAYDLVSLKYWGSSAITNFPISNYEEELKVVAQMTDQEILSYIRRCSTRFARGKSTYRGVARQPGSGKWLANKGKCKGVSFLGTFDTEEEAAMAFDIETIKVKGFAAVTNFDIHLYDVEAILQGKAVLVEEETAKRLKEATSLGPWNKKRRMRLNPNLGEQQEMLLGKEDEIGAPEISRKEQQVASHSRFHDETNNPYQEKMSMEDSRDASDSSTSGFQHVSSSAFQHYKTVNCNEAYNVQNVIAKRPIFEPRWLDGFQSYQFESTGEQEARAQGTGIRHANTSCFKPYSNKQICNFNIYQQPA